MNLEINLYVFLLLLEVIFVVSGVGVFLFLRNVKQKRRLADLEQKLARQPEPRVVAQVVPAKSTKPVEQKTFEDYLRAEIDNSSVMLGESDGLERLDAEPVDEDDEDAELRNILAMRHQFLQLELDAQALSKDPEAKRNHMLEGMRALITALTPEPLPAEISSEQIDENERKREQQLQDQIAALRAAVNNQHDVMKDLRKLLKEHLGDSAAAQEIIAEIEKAEAEAEKLETSLAELTKPGGSTEVTPGGTPGVFATVDESDTDMLKNLVGNQQNTINKLKNMLAEAIPDVEAAEQLKQAVDKVQRSNQELGTCVMVLEDENSRLRTEVETLQEKIQDFETQPTPETEAEQEPDRTAESAVATEEAVAETEAPRAEFLESEDKQTAEADVDDIAAVLDEVAAPESAQVTSEETAAPADDIDTILEQAAEDKTSSSDIKAPEAEPDDIEDIDALLDEATSHESVDGTATVESESVDDIDALLEAEQADDKPVETPTAEEPPAEETTAVDDIDALLEEAASEQPDGKTATAESAESEVTSDDEDLDALLQDVAAASQEEDQDKEKSETEEAMDEVDALLAEIAADNKKTGG